MYELEQQIETSGKSSNFFRLATAHFSSTVPLVAQLLFKWRGGRQVDLDEVTDSTKRATFQLSHAVVDAENPEDVAMAKEWKATRCVSYAWIVDSHLADRKISDKKYEVDVSAALTD